MRRALGVIALVVGGIGATAGLAAAQYSTHGAPSHVQITAPDSLAVSSPGMAQIDQPLAPGRTESDQAEENDSQSGQDEQGEAEAAQSGQKRQGDSRLEESSVDQQGDSEDTQPSPDQQRESGD